MNDRGMGANMMKWKQRKAKEEKKAGNRTRVSNEGRKEEQVTVIEMEERIKVRKEERKGDGKKLTKILEGEGRKKGMVG